MILLAFGALYAALTPVLTFSVVYIMAGMLLLAIITTVILPREVEWFNQSISLPKIFWPFVFF